MDCRQCLPLSVAQLKGKHCQKTVCRYVWALSLIRTFANAISEGFCHILWTPALRSRKLSSSRQKIDTVFRQQPCFCSSGSFFWTDADRQKHRHQSSNSSLDKNIFKCNFRMVLTENLKSCVWEGKRPVSGQSRFWKFAGLPDRTWFLVQPYIRTFSNANSKGFVTHCEHPHFAPANSALQDRKLTPFSVNSHVLVLAISSLSHHCNYFNTLCTTIRCTARTFKVFFSDFCLYFVVILNWFNCFSEKLQIFLQNASSNCQWYFVTKIVLTYCDVPVIKKNFWNSRLKADNLQNFWDH